MENVEAEYRVLLDGSEPRRVMGRAVLYTLSGHMAGLRGIEIDRELRTPSLSASA